MRIQSPSEDTDTLSALETLEELQTPVTIYMDYKNLKREFWDESKNQLNEQGREVYALLFRYSDKLRLVIHDSDLKDSSRLKPFRELQRLKRNVRVVAENGQIAFLNAKKDLLSGKQSAHIHLSKAEPSVKNVFIAASQKEISFFSYSKGDSSSGLLTAALLWTYYNEAGKRLDGISMVDGYLTMTGEFLRNLAQQSLTSLAISVAA